MTMTMSIEYDYYYYIIYYGKIKIYAIRYIVYVLSLWRYHYLCNTLRPRTPPSPD